PLTFQQATSLTKDVEVRYLWIDSVCIVQNDAEDMKIEFSTMPSVYGNAASSSKNSTEGLFNPAGLSPLPPCSGPFKWETSGDMATIRFVMIHPVVSNWNDVTCGSGGGPLSQREWVAQQRHLARRAVHFT
ncbi:uncharacterized protein K444DRAFT_490149, partial [Hyaloscypha bicolor E]